MAQERVPFMKMFAAGWRGCVLAQTGKASEAVQAISAAIAEMRAIGASTWGTAWLTHFGVSPCGSWKTDDAWRCIGEAMTRVETTKERWYQPEVNRIAGEITLKSLERDTAKAQAYFRRALEVARAQQAKSWELRAAVSMAPLWRSQGKQG